MTNLTVTKSEHRGRVSKHIQLKQKRGRSSYLAKTSTTATTYYTGMPTLLATQSASSAGL